MNKNINGYTLVELMVSVAIVAVLASIAAPAFKDAKYAVYRAQGKSTLSAIHVAETVFHNEYKAYSGFLDRIGFNMTGNMYFSVGFNTDKVDTDVVFEGTPPPNGGDCRVTCYTLAYRGVPTACSYTMNWQCKAPACGASGSATSEAKQNTFTAEAHAHFDQPDCSGSNGGTKGETWSIDQSKIIRQLPWH